MNTFVDVDVVGELSRAFAVNGALGYALVFGFVQFGVTGTALARHKGNQGKDNGTEPSELHNDFLKKEYLLINSLFFFQYQLFDYFS